MNVTSPGFSIAPMLYSGTKIWSYLPHGYGNAKASAKKSSPWRVIRRISSESKCSAIDARQNAASGTRCSPRRHSDSARTYGPAATQAM